MKKEAVKSSKKVTPEVAGMTSVMMNEIPIEALIKSVSMVMAERLQQKPFKTIDEIKQDLIIELFGIDAYEKNDTFSTIQKEINWIEKKALKNRILEEELDCEYLQLNRADRRRLCRKGNYSKDKNGIITLSVSVAMVRTLIAVMKLKGSKADITKQAEDLINKAKTSPFVSIPLVTIDALLALAELYGDSSVAAESEAWRELNNGLKAMMSLFQNFANYNPLEANEAILSGGFSVMKISPRKQQKWSAKNTPVEGILALKAAGSRVRSCHDWWISYNGATFSRLDPTTAAETLVTGLASGITVYFMHQLITKDGPQGFDLVLKKVVGAD